LPPSLLVATSVIFEIQDFRFIIYYFAKVVLNFSKNNLKSVVQLHSLVLVNRLIYN